MKNRFFTLFILSMSLFLMAFQCDDSSNPTMDEEHKALMTDKKAIEDLAANSICTESTDCKFIALGSKPCGGPWSYIIYSSSIDIIKFEKLVEDYNKNEDAYNLKWDVVSDCAFVIPPTSTICENNKCVPVY